MPLEEPNKSNLLDENASVPRTEFFVFQEPLKIDFQKFMDELKRSDPTLKDVHTVTSDSPQKTVRIVAGTLDIGVFILNQKGNAELYQAPVWDESKKDVLIKNINRTLGNSVITGEYQDIVKNTTYESLNAQEQRLYNYYENFRDDLQKRIDDARKSDKPILIAAGEDHTLEDSLFFQHVGLDIAVENGFTAVFEYPQGHIHPDVMNASKLKRLDAEECAANLPTFHITQTYKAKFDNITPDLNLSKNYIVDLPVSHPLQEKLYALSLTDPKEHQQAASEPENMKIRNDFMISQISEIKENNLYLCTGGMHLQGIIEDETIKSKYLVIPLDLGSLQGDDTAFPRNPDAFNYLNGTLSEESYSFGKPQTINTMAKVFSVPKPEVMAINSTDPDAAEKSININKYIEEFTSYNEAAALMVTLKQPDIELLSRRFSKIYEDRHSWHMKDLEQYITNSISTENTTPGLIDKQELKYIKDYISILQKEFGAAISMKQDGKTLEIDIKGEKKGYTLF